MGKRGKCVICGTKFQPKKKGFKRFSLKAQLGQNFDIDVATALSKVRPDIGKLPDDGHVCDSCFRLLRSTLRQREQLVKAEIEWENRFVKGPYGKQSQKTRTKQRDKLQKNAEGSKRTRKRKLGEVQNILNENDAKKKRLKLEPTVSVLCKNGGHKNYMKKAIAYLLQYRYHKAITTLITGSKRAKKAFLGVLENEVRKEVFYFCKSADNCSRNASVESFSWKRECRNMESQLPTFFSACYAAMDKRKGTDLVHSTYMSRKIQIRPRLGLMMMLPLYTRRERKFGFVPHILSLLLHHYGNHEKVMKILHGLGICRPPTAALMTKVNELKKEEGENLLLWASKNLGEVKQSSSAISTTKPPSRRGKLPTAMLPPTDSSLSDESGGDELSDDENALVDDDEEDSDDIDDSSILSLLSSDEDEDEDEDDDEEEEEEEEGEEEVWKVVREDEVEVEGCIEDIEGQEVEIVLINPYKTLKGGT